MVESYKDPFYADLSDRVERKLGLPSGLLHTIVTRGERSNASQVSEAGARTVFQVIPQTRNAVLKKHGIDAYLSPENAAEVAGLLLKESLQRNKGDVSAAVAEYHGGTNKRAHGPINRAYVNRVMTALVGAQGARDESTPSAIAQVYDAYTSGRMSAEDAAAFESDVNSGALMLPRGAKLKTPPQVQPAPKTTEPVVLPEKITQAYVSGTMSPEDRAALEADVQSGLVKMAPLASSRIPEGENFTAPTEQALIPQDTSSSTIGEKLVGAGEAALTLGTGATTGAAGFVGGAIKGLGQQLLSGEFGTQEAADAVERAAIGGAEALTYAPRTEVGQQITGAIGEAAHASGLAAIAPMAGEMAVIGKLGPAAASQSARAAGTAKTAMAQAFERAGVRTPESQTPGTGTSAGAAAVDIADVRQAQASELPVPINLTKGQRTRDFEQQRFEREAAKDAEMGAPIRERMSDQNQKVAQNFDSFLDGTGAEKFDALSVGRAVDDVVRSRAAREKNEVRVAYKKAEKSEEAQALVSPDTVVKSGVGDTETSGSVIGFLNDTPSGLKTTALTDHAKQYAVRLGIAEKADDGTLIARPTTVAKMEVLRREINQATGFEPTEIRQSAILKGLIDATTEPVAGPLYAHARRLRARYAERFENRAVIADLLEMKRGTSDRKVALEDVASRIVERGSLDDLRFARRIIQTSGQEGVQAWKEIQGSVIRDIQNKVFGNISRDETGNVVASPSKFDRAIKALDEDNKLDYLFGKQGAGQLRLLRDVAMDIYTTNPGSVNTSTTASVLLQAMDTLATFGFTGAPIPAMTGLRSLQKTIRNRAVKARISEALK
jgi:hypothetical protein